ncbi:MAG: ATP-dependent DNA helicase RecG, partial [bacterium]
MAGKNRKTRNARPSLSTGITGLPGVGPGREKLLGNLGIRAVADLLLYPPRRYIDRKAIVSICDLAGGGTQTIAGDVISVEVRHLGRKSLAVARVRDGTGTVKCVWFNQPYLKNSLKRGGTYVLSGPVRVDRFGTALVHPEYEAEGGKLLSTGRVVPVYRLTPGLGQRTMRRLVDTALTRYAGSLGDPLPPRIGAALRLLPLDEALRALHFPDDIDHAERARRRLAFDEMLLFQTLFARARAEAHNASAGTSDGGRGTGRSGLLEALPFRLTSSQQKALTQVLDDIDEASPMRRLIQGDVGCGKTVVAGLGAGYVCGGGGQVALMCPTELLAEQHCRTMTELLGGLGHSVALLTAGLPAAEQTRVVEGLAAGDIDAVVGTHSLFSDRVDFRSLGLVIVDEEQRFGVLQRARLIAKSPGADFLAVSATPIPRTLALTAYGDLDISVIDEMPPGRGSHVTTLVPEEDADAVLMDLAGRIKAGEQAFYICPVLDEGSLGLTGVRTAGRRLDRLLGARGLVGLLTGRTPREERQATLAAFEAGDIACIVATSVLEVGVDVPGATLLVVEQADRFGLSQLHQMRGRVQRSSSDSRSYFIVPDGASERALERLEVLGKNYDGFDIAEHDLMLRGPGDIVGRRQHGIPDLRFTSLPADLDLLEAARDEASRSVMSGDSVYEEWLEVLSRAAGGERGMVH